MQEYLGFLNFRLEKKYPMHRHAIHWMGEKLKSKWLSDSAELSGGVGVRGVSGEEIG